MSYETKNLQKIVSENWFTQIGMEDYTIIDETEEDIFPNPDSIIQYINYTDTDVTEQIDNGGFIYDYGIKKYFLRIW